MGAELVDGGTHGLGDEHNLPSQERRDRLLVSMASRRTVIEVVVC